ncbi:MotE family protein [Sphingomonas morindae]|uniref:Magnesium transporter n=1 Tax=Sphingomonas morindae TaxID=1541170 RepID=A0ABY4X558_9SPHN|nr:magnesium transporter [Sphingomonas morindae]USI71986.1 magnesium transporter [Sphingomonas morindae]
MSRASRPARRRPPRLPPLLLLTGAAAGFAAITHAVEAGTQPPPPRVTPAASALGAAVFEGLSDRDRALARQMRALDLRERSARAAEQRLQQALDPGQGGSAPAGGFASPGPAQPARPAGSAPASTDVLDDLARIYQTMKPARAAPIFSALEPEVQAQLARHMRDRAVAALMAEMDPLAAARLSTMLAGRRVPDRLLPPAPRLGDRTPPVRVASLAPPAAARDARPGASALRPAPEPLAASPAAPPAAGPRGR